MKDKQQILTRETDELNPPKKKSREWGKAFKFMSHSRTNSDASSTSDAPSTSSASLKKSLGKSSSSHSFGAERERPLHSEKSSVHLAGQRSFQRHKEQQQRLLEEQQKKAPTLSAKRDSESNGSVPSSVSDKPQFPSIRPRERTSSSNQSKLRTSASSDEEESLSPLSTNVLQTGRLFASTGLYDFDPDHDVTMQKALEYRNYNKVYFEGFIMRKAHRDPDGRLAQVYEDAVIPSAAGATNDWSKWFAQLANTTLLLWKVDDLEAAVKSGTTVPPVITEISDGFAISSASKSQLGDDKAAYIFAMNTIGLNSLLFCVESEEELTKWLSAIRLAIWERSRLEEIYTGALFQLQMSSGVAWDNLKACAKEKFTGSWVKVRLPGDVEWRRVWCVVHRMESSDSFGPTNSHHMRRGSLLGFMKRAGGKNMVSPQMEELTGHSTIPTMAMYSSNKPAKNEDPVCIVQKVWLASAIYPGSSRLIETSSLFKVDGVYLSPLNHFKDGPGVGGRAHRQGSAFFMDDSGGNSVMLQWLYAIFLAFRLHGQPETFSFGLKNPKSFYHALPSDPSTLFMSPELVRKHVKSQRQNEPSTIYENLLSLAGEKANGCVLDEPSVQNTRFGVERKLVRNDTVPVSKPREKMPLNTHRGLNTLNTDELEALSTSISTNPFTPSPRNLEELAVLAKETATQASLNATKTTPTPIVNNPFSESFHEKPVLSSSSPGLGPQGTPLVASRPFGSPTPAIERSETPTPEDSRLGSVFDAPAKVQSLPSSPTTLPDVPPLPSPKPEAVEQLKSEYMGPLTTSKPLPVAKQPAPSNTSDVHPGTMAQPSGISATSIHKDLPTAYAKSTTSSSSSPPSVSPQTLKMLNDLHVNPKESSLTHLESKPHLGSTSTAFGASPGTALGDAQTLPQGTVPGLLMKNDPAEKRDLKRNTSSPLVRPSASFNRATPSSSSPSLSRGPLTRVLGRKQEFPGKPSSNPLENKAATKANSEIAREEREKLEREHANIQEELRRLESLRLKETPVASPDSSLDCNSDNETSLDSVTNFKSVPPAQTIRTENPRPRRHNVRIPRSRRAQRQLESSSEEEVVSASDESEETTVQTPRPVLDPQNLKEKPEESSLSISQDDVPPVVFSRFSLKLDDAPELQREASEPDCKKSQQENKGTHVLEETKRKTERELELERELEKHRAREREMEERYEREIKEKEAMMRQLLEEERAERILQERAYERVMLQSRQSQSRRQSRKKVLSHTDGDSSSDDTDGHVQSQSLKYPSLSRRQIWSSASSESEEEQPRRAKSAMSSRRKSYRSQRAREAQTVRSSLSDKDEPGPTSDIYDFYQDKTEGERPRTRSQSRNQQSAQSSQFLPGLNALSTMNARFAQFAQQFFGSDDKQMFGRNPAHETGLGIGLASPYVRNKAMHESATVPASMDEHATRRTFSGSVTPSIGTPDITTRPPKSASHRLRRHKSTSKSPSSEPRRRFTSQDAPPVPDLDLAAWDGRQMRTAAALDELQQSARELAQSDSMKDWNQANTLPHDNVGQRHDADMLATLERMNNENEMSRRSTNKSVRAPERAHGLNWESSHFAQEDSDSDLETSQSESEEDANAEQNARLWQQRLAMSEGAWSKERWQQEIMLQQARQQQQMQQAFGAQSFMHAPRTNSQGGFEPGVPPMMMNPMHMQYMMMMGRMDPYMMAAQMAYMQAMSQQQQCS